MTPLAQRRQQARDALMKAKARGDTRDQHYAALRLRDATTAQLRAEVRPSLIQRIGSLFQF